MNMNRRVFFSLLLAQPAQATSLRVAVLETTYLHTGFSRMLNRRSAYAAKLEKKSPARCFASGCASVAG